MLRPAILPAHTISERHILGSRIRIPDDGTDLVGAECFEGIVLTCPGCFRRITFVPIQPSEEITDLPVLSTAA